MSRMVIRLDGQESSHTGGVRKASSRDFIYASLSGASWCEEPKERCDVCRRVISVYSKDLCNLCKQFKQRRELDILDDDEILRYQKYVQEGIDAFEKSQCRLQSNAFIASE